VLQPAGQSPDDQVGNKLGAAGAQDYQGMISGSRVADGQNRLTLPAGLIADRLDLKATGAPRFDHDMARGDFP
jgi:hypothetical protein